MKAGIYLGKEAIEIRELDLPEVGNDDVLVQNLYSSICGTDVAVFTHGPNTGHKVTVGGEFGHETVSRVVKVGKNVTEFVPGERVYPYPLFAKDDPKRAGILGGFSEYILIPNARKNHSLYPIDERISNRLASLIEPFTVGCRAARRGMVPADICRRMSGMYRKSCPAESGIWNPSSPMSFLWTSWQRQSERPPMLTMPGMW